MVSFWKLQVQGVFTLGLSYSEFHNDSNDKDGDKQVAVCKKDYQA